MGRPRCKTIERVFGDLGNLEVNRIHTSNKSEEVSQPNVEHLTMSVAK